QCLARRYAQTQTRRVQFVPAAMMIKQHAVDNRHAEKDRRTIFFEDPADNIRRWFLATKNRSQPVEQREGETVAEPISKRQTRRRKQPVAFTKTKHFPTESLVGIEDVRLPVHRPLRFAGAA